MSRLLDYSQFSLDSFADSFPDSLVDSIDPKENDVEVPRSVASLQDCMGILAYQHFEDKLAIHNEIVLRIGRVDEEGATIGNVSDHRFGQGLLLMVSSEELLVILKPIFESHNVEISDGYDDYDGSDCALISLSRDMGGLQWKMDVAGDFSTLYNVFCSMVHSLGFQLLFSGPYKSLFLLQQSFPIEMRYRRHFLVKKVEHEFVIAYCAHKSTQCLQRHMSALPLRSIKDIPSEQAIEEMISPQKTITVAYTFKQREVSCLIGHHGTRLNEIRSTTRCVIKVMPVSNDISLSLPRNLIPQEIRLSGFHENVVEASKLIQHYIQLYRNSDNNYI